MATPTSDRSHPNKQGCVFILGNQLSEASDSHRVFAEGTARLWTETIGCQLFDGKVHLDLSSEQLGKSLRRISTMDTSQLDYLVVVIIAKGCSSHDDNITSYNNNRSTIYGILSYFYTKLTSWINTETVYKQSIHCAYGSKYSEKDTFSCFYNDNPSWKGKPKFFILNYCRFAGEKYRLENENHPIQIMKGLTFFPRRSHQAQTKLRMPTISDIVTVYGSSPFLIDRINTVIAEKWGEKSVQEMLTILNGRVKAEDKNQTSVFESSLGSNFWLHQSNPSVNNGPISESLENELAYDDQSSSTDVARLLQTLLQETPLKVLKDLSSLPPAEFRRVVDRKKEDMRSPTRTPSPRITQCRSRGCVLIICNALERGNESHRQECEMMKKLWVNKFGCDLFQGKGHLDKTDVEMMELFTELSKTPSDDYEYVVVIVSTHGGLEKPKSTGTKSPSPYFLGCHGKRVYEREVLGLFMQNECEWNGKEKIFILDYCRGHYRDKGVKTAEPFMDDELDYPDSDIYYADNILLPYTCTSTNVDDSVVMYATQEKYVALENTLIPAVAEVFRNRWKYESVLEMLTRVNEMMKQKDARLQVMSVFKSTLTKDFRFAPPAHGDSQNSD